MTTVEEGLLRIKSTKWRTYRNAEVSQVSAFVHDATHELQGFVFLLLCSSILSFFPVSRLVFLFRFALFVTFEAPREVVGDFIFLTLGLACVLKWTMSISATFDSHVVAWPDRNFISWLDWHFDLHPPLSPQLALTFHAQLFFLLALNFLAQLFFLLALTLSTRPFVFRLHRLVFFPFFLDGAQLFHLIQAFGEIFGKMLTGSVACVLKVTTRSLINMSGTCRQKKINSTYTVNYFSHVLDFFAVTFVTEVLMLQQFPVYGTAHDSSGEDSWCRGPWQTRHQDDGLRPVCGC